MHRSWSLPSPSVSSGLNSNLNVPLELGGSSGGALSYKEPPQSKLKKLWATTDPLEQNSKPGEQNVIFETYNRRCDHVTTTMFWLPAVIIIGIIRFVIPLSDFNRCYIVWAASGGLSLLWHLIFWPVSPESTWPINGLCGWWLATPCQLPPTPWKHCHLAPRFVCLFFICSVRQKRVFALKTANHFYVFRIPARGALERLPQHWPWDWPFCDPWQCHKQPFHQHRPRHRPPQGQEQR